MVVAHRTHPGIVGSALRLGSGRPLFADDAAAGVAGQAVIDALSAAGHEPAVVAVVIMVVPAIVIIIAPAVCVAMPRHVRAPAPEVRRAVAAGAGIVVM